jgi:Uncharacterized conserved protein
MADASVTEQPVKATHAAPRLAPPRMDRLPPFRVLLHNDDHNDMVFVVESIELLTPLPRVRAVEAMFAAHRHGVALLLVTHRERAELYREQFTSRGLTVTIEPAEGS